MVGGRMKSCISITWHVGKSGPLGQDGLDESEGYVYLLIMMDDLSNFAWMEPTGACTATLTAKHLLNW